MGSYAARAFYSKAFCNESFQPERASQQFRNTVSLVTPPRVDGRISRSASSATSEIIRNLNCPSKGPMGGLKCVVIQSGSPGARCHARTQAFRPALQLQLESF